MTHNLIEQRSRSCSGDNIQQALSDPWLSYCIPTGNGENRTFNNSDAVCIDCWSHCSREQGGRMMTYLPNTPNFETC